MIELETNESNEAIAILVGALVGAASIYTLSKVALKLRREFDKGYATVTKTDVLNVKLLESLTKKLGKANGKYASEADLKVNLLGASDAQGIISRLKQDLAVVDAVGSVLRRHEANMKKAIKGYNSQTMSQVKYDEIINATTEQLNKEVHAILGSKALFTIKSERDDRGLSFSHNRSTDTVTKVKLPNNMQSAEILGLVGDIIEAYSKWVFPISILKPFKNDLLGVTTYASPVVSLGCNQALKVVAASFR